MALIPPSFLDSVVALGMQSQDKNIHFTGTGFMYGYPTGEVNDNGAPTYWTFLVTNRHVVAKASERGNTLHARFNRPVGAESHTYPLTLKEPDGSLSWTTHEKADIAVLQLNADRLKADGIDFFFFPSDVHTFTVDQLREIDVSEGDGVFVLGFPLGEAGEERNYAIVRQGVIARARDWIRGNASTFLIDASVFPGNSGGPVLLKPEPVSVRRDQAQQQVRPDRHGVRLYPLPGNRRQHPDRPPENDLRRKLRPRRSSPLRPHPRNRKVGG